MINRYYFIGMGLCLMCISYILGTHLDQNTLIIVTACMGVLIAVSSAGYAFYKDRDTKDLLKMPERNNG